jgi:hypothetical protein
VKLVLQIEGGKAEMGYNIGTRRGGMNQPRWPKDLGVEVMQVIVFELG